ncbi:fatty acyl-CoA reductase 1-like [Neocloeon triangulifer]|uniref:fatty acyl-CoA reductase 1-like n=1 Tax=Neocloeon triangulifer TaxID=2078957 RepID=UPI00286F7270|nr:fatty acyl-CoA reductase 1-like [Neocloeon triangulifer]
MPPPCELLDDLMEPTEQIQPGIPDFFRGKKIFITGATGFMGKVLVEKLLRSCPELGTLYLLMRPKRGVQPEQRLNELLQSKFFARLRAERGEEAIASQIRVVEGDVSRLGLAISNPLRKELCKNVNIVFHVAATVRFDEPLRNAVLLNTRGTRELLALAKEMTNLKALVHVSTLFANCHHDHVLEEVYPTNAEPEKLISCAEWMDDAWLNLLCPVLTEERPNTYVYTKSLAEKLVSEASKTLPVAIFRPSIVMSTLQEPTPSWVDNLNGPSVVVLSGGNGMLKKMLCHEEKVAHVVPADLAINAMITLAWYLAICKPSECTVYNFTPPDGFGPTWQRFVHNIQRFYRQMPFSACTSVPTLELCKSKVSVKLSSVYLMMWAYLADLVNVVMGQKKRFARLQDKVNAAINSLTYFTTNQWTCDTENVTRMLSSLSPIDHKNFNFDLRKIPWDDYIFEYGVGIRQHIMKDELATVPSARKRVKWIRWAQTAMSFVFLAILVHFLASSYIYPLEHVVTSRLQSESSATNSVVTSSSVFTANNDNLLLSSII